MKKIIGRFSFLLLLFVLYAPTALACNGSCTADADCSANPCRFCDTDFGVCTDCCEFTEQITCPSACSWSGGECRNYASVSCGVAVPETPKSYRWVFFLVLFLGTIAALWKFAPKIVKNVKS